MVHETTHSLTDATASLQLVPATASRTGRLGVLLPARINCCMMASCQEQLVDSSS